jgi:hypothetical protein
VALDWAIVFFYFISLSQKKLIVQAIIFNAPGSMQLSLRACEQMATLSSLPIRPDMVHRLCHVRPSNPNIYNIYFEADIIPHILDYQIGQVSKIASINVNLNDF